MRYVWYQRGKCLDCGDFLWTNNPTNAVVCKCGKALVSYKEEINVGPMTDEELIAALHAGDFWWLASQTSDPTIDIIKG